MARPAVPAYPASVVELRVSWLPLLLGVFSGCNGGESDDGGPMPPECVAVETECTPQLPAEFARLHEEVLLPVCGVQGGACHGTAGAAGAEGGLVIDADLDTAFGTLMEGPDPFVVPGDAACSPLLARVNTDDAAYLMPPGEAGLADGLRCSLAQWVEAGAPR